MQTFNIWNKLNLYGLQIITFIFFISILNFANGQGAKVKNLGNHDDQAIHFGFYLALNNNTFTVKQSDYFVQKVDSVRSISSPWNMGAMLGFVVNLRISDHWDLRALPGVSFTERTLNYKFNKAVSGLESSIDQKFEYTYVELPLVFKYKSQRRANHRMYMLAGCKAYIATNSKKKNIKPDQLRLQNLGFGLEYGAGIDIYNQMFKLAPEIRFSHGISNMLLPDQFVYSKSLASLLLHTVTISFNFE
ncbi:MAG: hypothetical protein RLZZ175_184 [Bacteroidota bacterium]|jgi:hypothetical protein